MNELELVTQFPLLEEVLLKVIPPDPCSFIHEGYIIPEMMEEAMEMDRTIEEGDISSIATSLRWPEGPAILVTLSGEEWYEFKTNVIRKDKFLARFFNKNKLRKCHILQIHQWFDEYPSLFDGNNALKDQWYQEIQKFLDDKKFQKELEMQHPPILTAAPPSRYDYYDIEAKLHAIVIMGALLKTILVGYIQTYHPFLQKVH